MLSPKIRKTKLKFSSLISPSETIGSKTDDIDFPWIESWRPKTFLSPQDSRRSSSVMHQRPGTINLAKSAMQVYDHEENRNPRVKRAIEKVGDTLDSKHVQYEAVIRNFEILKKVSKKQQDDFH